MADIKLDPLIDSEGAGPGPSTLRHRRKSQEGKLAGSLVLRDPPLRRAVTTTGLSHCFTTFTLPPKYDRYTLVTRLWLQSRVVGSSPAPSSSADKGRGKGSDDENEDESIVLAPAGEARQITWRNLKIALDLTRTLGPCCVDLVLQHKAVLGLPAVVYILSLVVEGLTPAASVWASSQMLDLVEKSFSGSPASWPTAIRVALTAVGLNLLWSIEYDLFRRPREFIDQFVTYHLESLQMGAQLNLSASDLQEDETYTEVVRESGVFAGFDSMQGISCPPHSAFGVFERMGSLFASTIKLGVQSALLWRTIRQAMSGSGLTVGNGVLLALSLAPMAFDLISDKLYNWLNTSMRYGHVYDAQERMMLDEAELDTLRGFIEPENRDELVLFGLRGYILRRWDELSRKRTPQRMSWGWDSRILFDIVRSGAAGVVSNGFYVLLATKAIDSTLTLGALHMHKETSEMVFNTLQGFWWDLTVSWQFPFFLASMFAAQDGPAKVGPQLNYEDYREGSGMRLEARGLSFQYPGADEPTLRNIDLRIERGEVIGIVGENGSGKTTLIKALMGILPHEGSLLINDIEYSDYDNDTVHARMSSLFQDYRRYNSLTVRRNVGFGDTDKMDDDDALERALERGGAKTIVESVGGLECYLHTGVSRHHTSHRAKRLKKDDNGDGSSPDTPDENEDGSSPDTPSEEKTEGNAAASGDNAIVTSGALVVASGAAEKSTEVITGNETDGTPSDSPLRGGLSGGQWQRIALSRAWMRDDADLVVFDEPSASLDPKAEQELFQRIHSLSMRNGTRRTTTIFISHRYSTVRRADRIAYVENGMIKELGSHDELMALGGSYADMFNISKSGFD